MFRVLSATSLRFVALTLVALMSASSPSIAGPTFKLSSEGEYAFVSTYDPTDCSGVYVDVSRTSTKAASQTYLVYYMFEGCAQPQAVAYGRGYIPDTAFKVTGTKAALKLTIAAIPSFYTEGATGTIDLTFTPRRSYRESYSGHYSLTYFDRVFRSHGSWSFVSAQGSGTILTTSVAGVSAGVGESRWREMEIERTAK